MPRSTSGNRGGSTLGFTTSASEAGVFTGTPSGRNIDFSEQAMAPLALADPSSVAVTLSGPSGQIVSSHPYVMDVGQVLDHSIASFFRNAMVQVPATLLLHFATAFAIPRLLRNHDQYGAARAILLNAMVAKALDNAINATELVQLGEIAQSIGSDLSPTDMVNSITVMAEKIVGKKAWPSIIQFLTAPDGFKDEFELIKDLPPYELDAFSTSITQLSEFLRDTRDQRPLEGINLDAATKIQSSPFLRVIHALVKVRDGYQLTTIPTTLAHALDHASLDIPSIKRWTGMDSLDEDGKVIAGQFHFYISEQLFSEKISLLDIATTLAALDELIIGLPTLDIDLTSLIETVVRTNSGRPFSAKPVFGSLKGRNLLLPPDGFMMQDDPISSAFATLLSGISLGYVFNPVSVAPILSRIKGQIQAYRPGPEVTPHAISTTAYAETFAICYTTLVAVRRLLEDVLENHPRLSKRYDDLGKPVTDNVLDTQALSQYMELRHLGFQPFFDVPPAPNTAQALTSPSELSMIPPPFRLVFPSNAHVTQQPWYRRSIDEKGQPTIILSQVPLPRFLGGRPVHFSAMPVGVGPLMTLDYSIGRALTHRVDSVEQVRYSEMGAPVDFSQLISLVPVEPLLKAIAAGSDDDLVAVIADIIATRNPRLTDLSISAANNVFMLRSRQLGLTINGDDKYLKGVARLYTRFAVNGEDNDNAVKVSPIVLGTHNGYAYMLGQDPTVIYPGLRLFVENTNQGISNLDWFSVSAPIFAARPMADALANIYDVDGLFSKPSLAAKEIKEEGQKNSKQVETTDQAAPATDGSAATASTSSESESGSDEE